MAEPSMNDLVLRLDRLERQSRWARWVMPVVLVLVVIGLVAGLVADRGQRPSVVEAERFVVRDTRGNERAVLGLDYATSPEHSPVRLALYNREYGSSAVMYLSDAVAGVVIASRGSDEKRTQRVHLFAGPRAKAGLSVDTTFGEPVILLRTSGPAGMLVLRDENGALLFKAPPGG
jgi:hypothetical protein